METILNKERGNDSEYTIRNSNKVITIYSLNIDQKNESVFRIFKNEDRLSGYFPFGRYEEFIHQRDELIPTVIYQELIEFPDFKWKNINNNINQIIELLIVKLPSNQLLVLYAVEIQGELNKVIATMDSCYKKSILIGSLSLEKYIGVVLKRLGINTHKELNTIGRHYHQIVTVANNIIDEQFNKETVHFLIMRYNKLSTKNEVFAEKYPIEMNIVKKSICGLSQFVTVLHNHQLYIESSVYFSAIQYVGARHSLDNLRPRCLKLLQESSQIKNSNNIKGKLNKVKAISKEIENLNISLSLNIEESMHIGGILPSLRIEDYHNNLIEAGMMNQKANNVSKILERIESVNRANINLYQAIKTEYSSVKEFTIALLIALISIFSIPLTIILTFFASGVSEVGSNPSIMDFKKNSWLYISIFGGIVAIILSALILFLFLSWKIRKKQISFFKDL